MERGACSSPAPTLLDHSGSPPAHPALTVYGVSLRCGPAFQLSTVPEDPVNLTGDRAIDHAAAEPVSPLAVVLRPSRRSVGTISGDFAAPTIRCTTRRAPERRPQATTTPVWTDLIIVSPASVMVVVTDLRPGSIVVPSTDARGIAPKVMEIPGRCQQRTPISTSSIRQRGGGVHATGGWPPPWWLAEAGCAG